VYAIDKTQAWCLPGASVWNEPRGLGICYLFVSGAMSITN